MVLKYSNKNNGIRGKEIPSGVYENYSNVEKVLGVRDTGFVTMLVEEGLSILKFDSSDSNLKNAETVKARVLRGTPAIKIRSNNGWTEIKVDLLDGQKILINGSYFEQTR